MASDLIQRLAEWVEAAISHRAALPTYVAVRLALAWAIPTNTITLLLSDFANLCLISIAIAQRRASCLLQEEVRALVTVHPDIDEHEVERSVA